MKMYEAHTSLYFSWSSAILNRVFALSEMNKRFSQIFLYKTHRNLIIYFSCQHRCMECKQSLFRTVRKIHITQK